MCVEFMFESTGLYWVAIPSFAMSHLLLLVLKRSFCPPQYRATTFLSKIQEVLLKEAIAIRPADNGLLSSYFVVFEEIWNMRLIVDPQYLVTVHFWMLTLKKILKLVELSDTLMQTRSLSCVRGCQTQRPSWLSELPLMLQLTRLFFFFLQLTNGGKKQQPLCLAV